MVDPEPLEVAQLSAKPVRHEPLPAAALRAICDPASLGFETTAELTVVEGIPGQERALEALRLGLSVRKEGFNVYALGPTGAGKQETVLRLAREQAHGEPTPDAWCYVHNFEDARRPRALRLPAGRARPFAQAMDRLLDELRAAIPAAFESESYRSRRAQLETRPKARMTKALESLRRRASDREVEIVETPTGISIAPVRDGKIIELDAFHEMPEEEQRKRAENLELVGGWLRELSSELPRWLKQTRDELRALDREVTGEAVRHLFAEVRAAHADLPAVLAHLDAVQADILENAGEFIPAAHELPSAAFKALFGDGSSRRYRVNVLVEPEPGGGAPVVIEDNPTYAALFGEVEHRTELGAAVTDVTLIAGGAFHRANGGYLVMEAHRLLMQPFVWGEVKRCLLARKLRIEPLAHRLGLPAQAGLEPEAIPLEVKVILTGERLFYYLLAEHDPEFLELFKVAADFDDTVDRSPATEQEYARLCAQMARNRGARPLDRGAVATAIEHASRVVGDAGRLSLHVQGLGDLIDEADHDASGAGRKVITADDVRRAIDARERRASRIRDRMLDEMRRGTILVDTSGERVGQVNGLSVTRLGDLNFGRPSRITARVRVGGGEVIDIEREVELGGPIHSKGVLILTGFLGARYAGDRPLSLAASLVFEQSYGPVEGDSASAAELCALLSALAELPIRQSFGVTGSVNQHGVVQPVGGVNEKIEGFFDACRIRGGPPCEQGVLIPASNAQHLMLRDDVVEAVRQGKFAIHAVQTIDEAIEILTGVPAGERLPDGQFPDLSVNGRVERRLGGFAKKRQAFQAPAGQGG